MRLVFLLILASGCGESEGRSGASSPPGPGDEGAGPITVGEGEAEAPSLDPEAGEGEGETPTPDPDAGEGEGETPGAEVGEGEGEGETPPPGPELWVYIRKNLMTEQGRDDTLALIERAAAAGYTGVGLADFKFSLVHTDVLIPRYDEHLAQVVAKVEEHGMDLLVAMFPFGYSEGILRGNPNWAEGRPIRGAPFVVSDDGTTLEHAPEFGGLTNGGFEDWQGVDLAGWDWHDDPGVRTVVDREVFRSGEASMRIDPGEGNARAVQTLRVTPHRQYRVWWHVRSEGLSADWHNVMLLDGDGRSMTFSEVHFAEDADWTRGEYILDSGDSDTLRLYLGLWGGSRGRAWFDDVGVEETALVNVIRRPGAPASVRRAAGAELTEGVDVDAIAGQPIDGPPGFPEWHEPALLGVPEGSALTPGEGVALDYYAVAPVHGSQVGACLTEPAIDDWMRQNMAALDARFPPGVGWFLQHDEMRHMNTCASCTATGLSAGALLADHVRRATGIVRGVRPLRSDGGRLYIWSDMFDPHHNARVDYYLGEGDLSGSWEGLPDDLVVMNWNRGVDSLAHFESLGHRQISAGYYDSGAGADSALREITAAGEAGATGLIGLMYTTWRNDYSQLEAYAEGARAAWP